MLKRLLASVALSTSSLDKRNQTCVSLQGLLSSSSVYSSSTHENTRYINHSLAASLYSSVFHINIGCTYFTIGVVELGNFQYFHAIISYLISQLYYINKQVEVNFNLHPNAKTFSNPMFDLYIKCKKNRTLQISLLSEKIPLELNDQLSHRPRSYKNIRYFESLKTKNSTK